MTNDVQAAVERLRQHLQTRDAYRSGAKGAADYLRDVKLVIGTYFDPTPIDTVWLRSVGFSETGEAMAYCYSLPPISCFGVHPTPVAAAEWFCGREPLPAMTTRGQLRMLAAALGIELKEQP